MSYAGGGIGDVEVIFGVPVPVASGSQAVDPASLMPNLFGDYEGHPLVKYMRAVMPGSFGGPPSQAFNDAVKLAMLAMQYQGQPVELIKVAVHSAAAANADTFTASVSDPNVQAILFNTNATISYQNLIPVAEAVAAMAKPMIKLTFPPGLLACVQKKGEWVNGACKLPTIQLNVGKELVACVRAGGAWKNNTCSTTRKGVQWSHQLAAFVPVAAPTTAAPSTSHLSLYIGIAAGAVVIGTVGYLATRKRRAA